MTAQNKGLDENYDSSVIGGYVEYLIGGYQPKLSILTPAVAWCSFRHSIDSVSLWLAMTVVVANPFSKIQ